MIRDQGFDRSIRCVMNEEGGMKKYRRKLFMSSVLTMVFVASISMCVATIILYQSKFAEMKRELLEESQELSLLIEGMHEQGLPAKVILDVLHNSKSMSDDVIVGVKNQERIDIIYYNASGRQPSSLSFSEDQISETPIALSLRGESAFARARDILNVDVYAAYKFIPSLKWGVVRKIDVERFREPFIYAVFVSVGMALLSLLLGIIFLYKQSKRLFSKVNEADARLEEARIEAERANKAKSDFVTHMSHEIRTPLTAIIGFTKFILDHKVPHDEIMQLLRRVHHNGNHLLALINDILDLSKVESGLHEVEFLQVPLASIVNDVITAIQHSVNTGVEFRVTIPRGVPEIISTDPQKLKQILINILGNAFKFTVKGWVELEIDCDHSEAKRKRMDEIISEIIFTVKDTGTGIPEDKAHLIFDPFVQADNSVTRQYGGTGLGLAISRRLARMLGGDVVLTKTEMGVGSAFTITISCGDPKNVRMVKELNVPKSFFKDVEATQRPKIVEQQLIGVKVLLVEDGFDNQLLFSRVLERAGAKVATADDGSIALDKAFMGDFDVVLMDLQMPVMDGYAALEQLRARGYKKPIIALTAHALREEREKCRAKGFDDYLSKPVLTQDLIKTVKMWWKSQASVSGYQPQSDKKDAAISNDYFSTLDPVLVSMRKTFVAERLPQRITECQTALAQGDIESFRRVAHQLKGTLGSYGLLSLAEIAGAMEESIIQNPAIAGNLLSSQLVKLQELSKDVEKQLNSSSTQI